MIPFEQALEATLQKLGLAEPGAMLELRKEWAGLAGEPWATRAVPLFLRAGVLTVEVRERTALAFLRYAVGDLERRLAERFGPQVVQRVDLRPPARHLGGSR